MVTLLAICVSDGAERARTSRQMRFIEHSPPQPNTFSRLFEKSLRIVKTTSEIFMTTLEKNSLLELEILKHVETTPRLNNRMVAAKLGCSVKLAHALLRKLVDRGLLHVQKLHSRRWDYFLTPHGLSEKARLTYEFLDFSFHFYQNARKASSAVCRELSDSGCGSVAFLGTGDLAEIIYLGVKEWGLTLSEVYDDTDVTSFLGHTVYPLNGLRNTTADAVIICLYDKKSPTSMKNYLPNGVELMDNMHWIFEPSQKPSLEASANQAPDTSAMKRAVAFENSKMTSVDRMKKFEQLQNNAFQYISPKGREAFMRRNMSKRAIAPQST